MVVVTIDTHHHDYAVIKEMMQHCGRTRHDCDLQLTAYTTLKAQTFWGGKGRGNQREKDQEVWLQETQPPSCSQCL